MRPLPALLLLPVFLCGLACGDPVARGPAPERGGDGGSAGSAGAGGAAGGGAAGDAGGGAGTGAGGGGGTGGGAGTERPPPPEVHGIAPAAGMAGTALRIEGRNFSRTASVNEVRFRGASARAEQAGADGTSLVVHVPAGAATGPVSVWITRDGSTQHADGPVFTVLPAPPTLDHVEPPFATRGIESSHRLFGTGFTPEMRLWIGDHPLEPLYVSPNEVAFALGRETLPTGDLLVAVNNASGTSLPIVFPVLRPWLLRRVESIAPDRVLLDFNRVPDLATLREGTVTFRPPLAIHGVERGPTDEQVVLRTGQQPIRTVYTIRLGDAVRAADPAYGLLYRHSGVFGSFGDLPENVGSCTGRWDCAPGFVCAAAPVTCNEEGCTQPQPACGFTFGACVDARGWVPGDGGPVCGCNELWYPSHGDTAWGTTAHDGEGEGAAPCDRAVPCAGDGDCFPDGYCEKVDCGGPGVCTPRPIFCSGGDPWPVCGCDGVVYPSVCHAARAGVSVRQGPCGP